MSLHVRVILAWESYHDVTGVVSAHARLTPELIQHEELFSRVTSNSESIGLRHPSFKEEGAEKRCSECGVTCDKSRVPEPITDPQKFP